MEVRNQCKEHFWWAISALSSMVGDMLSIASYEGKKSTRF
jgi:hypothetical protein